HHRLLRIRHGHRCRWRLENLVPIGPEPCRLDAERLTLAYDRVDARLWHRPHLRLGEAEDLTVRRFAGEAKQGVVGLGSARGQVAQDDFARTLAVAVLSACRAFDGGLGEQRRHGEDHDEVWPPTPESARAARRPRTGAPGPTTLRFSKYGLRRDSAGAAL